MGKVWRRAALTLLALLAQPAAAEDAGDFYRGKTLSMIIPIGPGGAYDTYGRIVARHMPKHIPGNPIFVVRNMPGAGGVIASNYVYNVAPQDGTTLIVITSSFATQQIAGDPQIKYDARRFGAVGRLLDTTSILFFWRSSAIRTLADLLSKPSTVAVSSLTEVPVARLRAMNRYLGTRMKMIPGYPSAKDYVFAAESGETDGGSSTFVGLSQLFAADIAQKNMLILVQFAAERDPAMPDIPTAVEMAKDEEARQVFGFLDSNDEVGRSLFTTPGVPPERLAALRAAFDALLADPEFRAETARLKLPLAPKSGAALAAMIAGTFAVSPAALARVVELSQP